MVLLCFDCAEIVILPRLVIGFSSVFSFLTAPDKKDRVVPDKAGNLALYEVKFALFNVIYLSLKITTGSDILVNVHYNSVAHYYRHVLSICNRPTYFCRTG